MTKNKTKNFLYLLAAFILFLFVAVGCLLYYKKSITSGALALTQEQGGVASVSAFKTLSGTIASLKSDSITLSLQQPATVGDSNSVVVSISSSTPITKQVPKSPAEMAAAFKEFQRMQKESNGKPFTPPEPSTTVPLTLSGLHAGDPVLITLTASSTEGHFSAAGIQLLPASVSAQTIQQ